jgi:1-acyl-sn-glycerol-3-phosphate acyltransferase
VSKGSTDRAHRYARERGLSRVVYAIVRPLASVLLRSWFRLRVTGAEQIPAQGPVIVAANHKSFLDAFFLGLSTRRKVRFMAKVELFRGPLRWLFTRLGAFPVRRGEADREALTTARAVLDQGGVLIVFPEGSGSTSPMPWDRRITARVAWPSRPGRRSFPPRSSARRTCGSDRSRSRAASTSRSSRRSG